MMPYKFVTEDSSCVQRDDLSFIAWDAVNNRPNDIGGRAGREWLDAGSPQPEPYVAPPPPPLVVTKVQALVALHRTGKLDAVKAAVAADPEMQIWFDSAQTWQRDNPRILAMGQQLGLSSQDLDNLFALAKTVTE
jgi:hypothetical protein